jgi:hypothetical protein
MLQTGYLWGQAGIGPARLPDIVFVPLCHPKVGIFKVQKEPFTYGVVAAH